MFIREILTHHNTRTVINECGDPEPLYVWRLNTKTGKVTKKTITSYKIKQYGTISNNYYHQVYISNSGQGNSVIADSHNLDIVFNNKVVSFENDDDKAMQLLDKHLQTSVNEKLKVLTSAQKLYNNFKGVNV